MINEETHWLESIACTLSWLPSLPVFWSFWDQMRKSSMAGNKHLLHTVFEMFGPRTPRSAGDSPRAMPSWWTEYIPCPWLGFYCRAYCGQWIEARVEKGKAWSRSAKLGSSLCSPALCFENSMFWVTCGSGNEKYIWNMGSTYSPKFKLYPTVVWSLMSANLKTHSEK